MIVGMHRRFRAARRAERFIGAIGDHLVDVHVRLRAGAGLPDDERKMLVELAVDHLARGGDDRVGDLRLEQALPGVDLGGGELDARQRMHDLDRHAIAADRKILPRAFRLRAPIGPGRHGDVAEGVAFNSLIVGHRMARMKRRVSRASLCGISE